jgi:hypothetical protein
VRRRDNLAAASSARRIRLLVYPLIWWIGARMVEERERACDEDVVRLGNEPHVYAEGILNICKFYLQSPLPYASGVTGGDLKKRIDAIMNSPLSPGLTLARKLLLAAVGLTAVGGPVFIGTLHIPTTRAQSLSYEVASIKPDDADSNTVSMSQTRDGGVNFVNVSLKQLIADAYNVVCGKVCDEDQIAGGPKWIDSARFDVQTKGPKLPDAGKLTREQMRECIRALLANRFKLVLRRETKEKPVYHLVVAKSGSKLQEYTRRTSRRASG